MFGLWMRLEQRFVIVSESLRRMQSILWVVAIVKVGGVVLVFALVKLRWGMQRLSGGARTERHLGREEGPVRASVLSSKTSSVNASIGR